MAYINAREIKPSPLVPGLVDGCDDKTAYASEAIDAGELVVINGVNGSQLSVALASALAALTGELWIAQSSGVAGDQIRIGKRGFLTDVNTNGRAARDRVYLSDTPGATAFSPGGINTPVGFVEVVSATAGVISIGLIPEMASSTLTAADTFQSDKRVTRFISLETGNNMQGIGAINMSAVGAGATALEQGPDGQFITKTTGAVANDPAGFHHTVLDIQPRWLPQIDVVIKTGPSLADTVQFFGLYEAGVNPSNNQAALEERIGFSFLQGTDTNWQIDAHDGAARTKVDTGVPVLVSRRYHLRLVSNADATAFAAYIDGVAVGSISATLPAVATLLRPQAKIVLVAGGTAREFGTSNFVIQSR